MSKVFGIRMEGVGEQLEPFLVDYIKDKKEFVYGEIGTAHCQTFRAISDIIKENIKTNNWLCLGFDLPNSGNVDFNQINKIFAQNELLVSKGEKDTDICKKIIADNYHNILILRNNPREFIKKIPDYFFDCILIDANHSLANVTHDFLTIEHKIRKNGLVLFHDSGLEEIGTDCQGDGQYINVRGALENLGLLKNQWLYKRNGWGFVKEIYGTRKLNNDPNGGNSLAVFKKLNT